MSLVNNDEDEKINKQMDEWYRSIIKVMDGYVQLGDLQLRGAK